MQTIPQTSGRRNTTKAVNWVGALLLGLCGGLLCLLVDMLLHGR
jgi:hypothetical protein